VTFTAFLWFAVGFWILRKFWRWVELRNAQIDYENAFVAGLAEDIKAGRLQWPPKEPTL
jgi:hypothetical protein